MSFKQSHDLVHYQQATTTKFKTNYKFGYQVVVINGCTLPILRAYLNHFRPHVAAMNKTVLNAPDAPLWLKYNGEQDIYIGKQVTRFFKKELDLHITTTNIRGVVETEGHKLHQSGQISDMEMTAIRNINGHSGQVSRDYYLKTSRLADADIARNVLITKDDERDAAVLESFIDGEPSVAPLLMLNEAPVQQHPWGVDHPDINLPQSKRARWTTQELSYIRSWVKSANIECHKGSKNASRCLKAIRADIDCHNIFHPRHVTDSSRLRYGVDKVFEQCDLHIESD